METTFSSLDDALGGLAIPPEIRGTLALIDVPYLSFEQRDCTGQLVIHADLAHEVAILFIELYKLKFPISKMVPIAAYGWDDEASMADNNPSAFNYRCIVGSDVLSNHSLGRAIDINPLQNPYYARNGNIYPPHAVHDLSIPGTLYADSDIVALFKGRGWTWLGDREDYKDYQHFEKVQA